VVHQKAAEQPKGKNAGPNSPHFGRRGKREKKEAPRKGGLIKLSEYEMRGGRINEATQGTKKPVPGMNGGERTNGRVALRAQCLLRMNETPRRQPGAMG